ncbi:hypothetical protein GA0070616_4579 [Micromonospora nigra]|uniref:Nucleoside 2-deoxyribosyltransferase n=1 Tax=Micromonospora nigra TaxID=145857 RepID=A0A1C6SUF4_9ACTN|nr:hypothetical protein GA0070616_4579 [Micromonospora nigra]
MASRSEVPAPVPPAGLTPRRAYLLGPSHGAHADRAARFRAAVGALTAAGFTVHAPGASAPPDDTAALLSVVDADLDALAAADVVVTLPGSADLWELPIAGALGIPVTSFDAWAGRRQSA